MPDSQQPTEFDVVLGGQSPSPMSGAAVLGGIEGVIQRLASPLSAEQYAALQQFNQKCRKSGLDLLKQALVDETEYLQRLAYMILRQQPQPEVQEFLLQNMPYHLFEPLVKVEGSYSAHGGLYEAEFAFMPNSQQLLVALFDNSVKIWDLRSGELVQTLTGFEDGLRFSTAIAASPDGQSCYVGYSDGNIRQRKLTTGEIIRTLKGRSTHVKSLAISKNGSTLVVGSKKNSPEIEVWDLQSGQSYAFEGSAWYSHVDISADGRYAISYIHVQKVVKVWDLQQRKQLHTLTCPGVTHALISPDGKRIIVQKSSLFTEWSIETGEKLHSLPLNLFLPYKPLTAEITNQPQQRIQLWNPRSNRLISELSDRDYYLPGVFSPDGNLAAFNSKSQQEFVINVVGIRAIA
ncbi:serine/threonine protein kinase with WD-40 repeats [Calothrix sp. NIES-2100]|uniref:WD40 repeat domain-containing protein n=1 Tax=Calothrix sp. NIES-2100 TaxID=1954172 RepID=UPI000B5F0F69|nr:serine/threonine protein kinase with WD-40 repeats [Calothrix sp. NIES-2100]